jgi:predicted RNase H-like nuclease (RuvC/YqgF family)
MSDSVRPEITAFRELETLVRHLADELAGFRRRALLAESRVREAESQGTAPVVQEMRDLSDRVTQLEHENAALKGRVDGATARTKQLLDRVRFIRQQAQGGGER